VVRVAKSYVKFVAPEELKQKTLELLELAKGGGVLRKGVNEVTKAVERADAKLVVIAEDVDPEEIVMHLPVLCAEKNIPYTFVSDKVALGKAAGLTVQSSAIAVSKPGAGEEALRQVLVKVRELLPSKAPAEKKEDKPKKEARPKKEKAREEKPKQEAKKEGAPKEEKKEAVAQAPSSA
jgi:large subunit ribosomal protein L7Ae